MVGSVRLAGAPSESNTVSRLRSDLQDFLQSYGRYLEFFSITELAVGLQNFWSKDIIIVSVMECQVRTAVGDERQTDLGAIMMGVSLSGWREHSEHLMQPRW